MKLNSILENVQHIKKSNFNPNISFLTCRSQEIKKNGIFACLKGVNYDGHKFAKKALNAGAAAIVVEKDLNLPNQILVSNSHEAYAKMCANFYNNPAQHLKFIGVTGTNGKTSISKIIKDILAMNGKKVGLIGTIQNEIGSEIIQTEKTTPDHLDYQKLLKLMLTKKCEYVVMEVSSHALVQHRIADTNFEIAIFTNLSQDHLDYHLTMKNYFKAKQMLFQRSSKAIVNIDDSYGKELLNIINCESQSIGIYNKNADFIAKDIEINSDGIKYYITKNNSPNELPIDLTEKIEFKTPGIFSVYNTMAAFVCCYLLGINPNQVAQSIHKCRPIKGRSEKIKTDTDFTVICDYAHSPAGLENILTSIKSYKKTRIITLFGCGGDRDKNKRPKMGEIAAKNSDFLIITSDNPRTEDPEKIIKDIIVGVKKTNTPYVRIVNRKKAIFYAIKNAKKDDILLLAGKGHETYQVVGTSKNHLDEREIVKDAVEELQKEKYKENF